MKIERILLRNYRGVAEHEVALADGVTIIEGANEVGKSSLAEAVHLLIRYPDSSRHDEVEAVRPVHTGYSPEAEIDVRAGQYRFTYRKRWSGRNDAETTLRIFEPVPDTVHGRAAHDRAEQILRENADMDLWSALRVLQSGNGSRKNDRAGRQTALDQPALDGKGALMRALDQAAGAEANPTRDDYAATLVEAANKELARYVTSTKRHPTGDYKRAIEDEQAARAEVQRRQDVLDSVVGYIDAYRRCERKLDGLKKAAREQAPKFAAFEHEYSELQKAAQAAESLEAKAEAAKAQAENARSFLTARQALCSEAEICAKKADELAVAAQSLEKLAASKQTEAEAADAKARAAGDAKDLADAAFTTANADREHLRALEDLTDLRRRRTQATDAATRIAEYTAELAAIRITKADLAQLDKKHRRYVQARAALEAASSLVEISALDGAAEPVVRLDGEDAGAQPAAPGRFVRRLVDATTLTIDERIRIRITPGDGEHDQRSKVESLHKELTTAFTSLAVADIEDARAQCDRRGELEHRLAAAQATAEAAVGEQSLDTVAARITELAVRTEHYAAGRGTEALPADLAAADTALAEARETAKQRASEAEQAGVVADTFRKAAQASHTEALVALDRAQQAHAAAKRVERNLRTARTQVTDQELEEQHRLLSQDATTATTQWQSVAGTLDHEALDNARLSLDNARAVATRREVEIQQCGIELAGLRASLASDGDASERRDEAQAKHAAAAQMLASFQRREAAARLLCDTLNAKRDAAKRAYVEPFRRKLEQYARIVCGEPGLELLVSDDLAITHRVLDGAVVPYEDLSGGTREQLALCSRLACAALIDPEDGVPVIIDDALGFTDPDRLSRIGTVFNVTGGRSQIIVLTCTPGRFQGIGRATVIPLQRSSAAARPGGTRVPAAPSAPPAALGRPRSQASPASDAAGAVLGVLRETDEPLGRSDLVARAGIHTDEWTGAIRALLDAGEVEQQGEKRGAKYTAVRARPSDR